MKKVKRAFFAFQPGDCEAAQMWLTKLYDRGWELSRLYWFAFLPAKFVPRTRDDLKYCVDVVPYNGKSQVCPDDYDRIIEDSGWELFDCCNSLNVYKSKPGMDPAPIHTDPVLAQKRVWRLSVLPNLIILLAAMAILGVLAFDLFRSPPVDPLPLLASGWELLRLAGAVVPFLLATYLVLSDFASWRARRRGVVRPPRLAAARLRAILVVILLVFLWLTVLIAPICRAFYLTEGRPDPPDPSSVPILTASELESSETPHVTRDASIFLEWLSARQTLASGDLLQNRYDCRFSWVAGLAVATRLDRARADGLSPAPAELGFDESWTADGYLLLRQGNVVAELTGFPALTAPATLERVRAALELG